MICRIVYFVIHSYITHDIGIMLSELRDRFGSLQWHLRGLITQSAYLFNQSNRGPILAVVASYSWSIYKAGGKKSAQTTFWMRMENIPARKVANKLNTTPQTVHNIFSKSLSIIREHIKKHYPEILNSGLKIFFAMVVAVNYFFK